MLLRIVMALMVGAFVVAVNRPDEARREIEEAAPMLTHAAETCRRTPDLCRGTLPPRGPAEGR